MQLTISFDIDELDLIEAILRMASKNAEDPGKSVKRMIRQYEISMLRPGPPKPKVPIRRKL